MKPTRIVPRGVTVTVELTDVELIHFKRYVDLSLPLVQKVYGNVQEMDVQDAVRYVAVELKRTLTELVKHPLIEEFVDGNS